MARITYRTRLQDLLAKSYLSQSDRRFAQSLLDHYNHKKYMSAGRAKWVRTLEERYETQPTVNSNLLAEVTELRSRITDASSWDAGFIDSVIGQVNAGRDLSEKQIATVAKVNSRYSAEALAALDAFASEYAASEIMQTRFRIMVDYYKRNGYYSNITSRADADGFVPTQKQYDAITANKYAAKILAGWEAAPKFPAGSMALIRSQHGGAAWRAAGNGSRPVVIVAVNPSAPTNACKGNKIYKVLPVGCAQTFEVEERALKTHRTPKKKKSKKA